jgi:hypothetical protein
VSSPIAIGFSTQKKNLLSRTIRWFTGSKFSHCWVRYYHPLYRMNVVVEADLKGIIEIPYDSYVTRNDDIAELEPPDGKLVDLVASLPVLGITLGRRYDVESLIGRAWVFLWRWFGVKVKNPFADPKEDACVDSVIRLVSQVDPEFLALDAEVQTPQGVYDLLVKNGWRPVRGQESQMTPMIASK